MHKLNFENGLISLIQNDNSFENCSFICNNKDIIFSTVEYSNNPSYSNGLLVLRDSELSILNSYEIYGNSPCYSSFIIPSRAARCGKIEKFIEVKARFALSCGLFLIALFVFGDSLRRSQPRCHPVREHFVFI